LNNWIDAALGESNGGSIIFGNYQIDIALLVEWIDQLIGDLLCVE
jgi:hypothetical protein